MKQHASQPAEKYIKAHRRKKRWYKAVTGLACIVAFCTVYALILPAITLERSGCEIPEHTHSQECYTQVTSIGEPVPICTTESLQMHRHDRSCYDESGALTCGYADFVIHHHDAFCYDENGNLWCPLPEIETHTHTESCYSVPEASAEVHTHTDDCYTMERGELTCTESTEPAHTHTDDCYTETSALACEEDHEHTESCYETVRELTCGYTDEPAHEHTDECYEQIDTLICELSTEPVDTECEEDTKSELICREEEVIPHEHDSSCFDENLNLVCGKVQILEHQHCDSCFETADAAVDVEILTCTNTDETHVHTAFCYGTWELTCGMEEHTHTAECFTEAGEDIPETGEDTPETGEDTPGMGEDTPESGEDTPGMGEDTPESGEDTPEMGEDTPEMGEDTPEMGEDTPETSEDTLGPEELSRIETVIALIDALPSAEEARAQLDACNPADDPEGYNARLEALQTQVSEAITVYDALTEAQQARVSNIEKLEALEWLLREPAAEIVLPLRDDSAYVSELTVTGADISGTDKESAVGTMTVHNGDTLSFRFLVRTVSYSGASFCEGRLRLQFVLPLTEDQAAFALSAMDWLDRSTGYEPILSTEARTVDGSEVMCQVLTGWALLSAETEGGSVIPGEFTGTVPVTALDMEEGDGIALQISAAMEYNTWEGICEAHRAEETLTVASKTYTVTAGFTEEEQQEAYEQFLAELEALEALEGLDDQSRAEAEDLLERLEEAYQQGQLTQDAYAELYERTHTLLDGGAESIAEAAVGTNWIMLRDSGWFEAYSNSAVSSAFALRQSGEAVISPLADGDSPSDVQVVDRGGTNSSTDGSVSVSKTISGTELENVFDITLQVQTSMNLSEIIAEPDMAVVIVMDISNTMNSNFGGVTRYAAAMTAAEDFLDQFAAQNTQGISKVGYVAFNTDAHQIFGLRACSTQSQANALKNTMRTTTGSIINAAGYNDSHSRFTNVEAGLAMASDMLNGVSNKNKFIIFLSDGFPTTYISSGYSGYDPYDSTGRFYDHVLNKRCLYGTSYSDEAAIRARKKAAAIKASGTTIFSIGVDVAGQTIQKYITQSENANGFSVVDRTGTSYEIGDASSTEAYKNWLKNSIGSGYYYDSTDSDGLSAAYLSIFETIKEQVQAGSVADWVTEDPLPTAGGTTETVEFIGFYNKTPALVFSDLTGTHEANGENTAQFNNGNSTINWDLKQSGYLTSTSGGTTTYTYSLVYRVRLKNENAGFTEGTVYPTNDPTTLQYRTIEGSNGNLTVSDPKTVEFLIPSVQGYLAELTFKKVDRSDSPLAGAEFTLSHDTDQCSICRGDGSSVTIADRTAVSGEDGAVTFQNIPSGHIYTLEETKIPDGYSSTGSTYTVEIAYDKITVTVTGSNGNAGEWNGTIVNNFSYELPQTGGAGTMMYTAGGLLLMSAAMLVLHNRRKAGRRVQKSS